MKMKKIATMRMATSRARVETIELPKSDCAIIPPKTKAKPRFDSFEQFVFETVFRLIALHLIDSRMAAAKALPKFQAPGFDYGVNVLTTVCTALLVPFTAPCATFLAVIAVFFVTFLAVRTGPA